MVLTAFSLGNSSTLEALETQPVATVAKHAFVRDLQHVSVSTYRNREHVAEILATIPNVETMYVYPTYFSTLDLGGTL